jgi:GNAT superfamily N-acetyltransferase
MAALADHEKMAPPEPKAQQRLLQDAFGPNPRIEVLLAEQDGKVVAYAILMETYASFLGLPTLYLEDLFVDLNHRARGVGYSLFQYCAREAVRRGCGRMDWMVLDWNQIALDFYDRLGAQALKGWLLHRLSADQLQEIAESP